MELKLTKYTPIFFIICISWQTAVGSGWCDYDTRLPNGYELVRTNVDTIVIFAPDTTDCYFAYNGHLAVPTKITSLNVQAHVVFGRTVTSPDANPRMKGPLGFFILDTKNHKVQLGLDKESWLTSLKLFGVKKEPSLKKPSRFFMIKIQLPRALKWMMVGIGIALLMLMWHKFHKPHKLRAQVCEK